MPRFFSILLVIGVLVACKSKQATTTSNTTTASNASNEQFVAVQAKYPDATKAEWDKGQSVYYGPCTKCHGEKNIKRYSENEMTEIIDEMSKKARITAEEKRALVRFVYGMRNTK